MSRGSREQSMARRRSALFCTCHRGSISVKSGTVESDLNRLWIDMVLGTGTLRKGTVAAISQFNRRIAPPGTRYHYASIEPDVLGMVLHYEKVWEPIGAEADAKWTLDAEGIEVAHFGYNAVLRDYARLGRLLAYDGAWA